MKRWVSVFFCVQIAIVAMAQDIIITRDAQRVECKVMEVSSAEVRYKAWGNIDGPTFVLFTSEISSILFENGMVKTFNTPAATTTPNNATTNSNSPMVSTSMPVSPIAYNSPDYQSILQAEHAYGKKLLDIGAGIMCIGIIFPVGLGTLLGGGPFELSISFMAIGSACIAVGVPLIAVGAVKKNKSYLAYNMPMQPAGYALTLNLQSSANGLGLALHF
ncbi:MAG: hypothetical protein ACI4TV_05760 [Paludibacteraceae bacterium]